MKILFISSSIESKFNPFLNAFKNTEDSLEICYFPNYKLDFYNKILFNLLIHKTIFIYNKLIKKTIRQKYFDLTIVVKGTYIFESTTILLKKSTKSLIFWSNDDISLRHNNSYFLRNSLKHYDLVYTMKILNILNRELDKFNVQNMEYLLQCYSEDLFKKINLNRIDFKYDVTFIGTYEEKRFETIKYLVNNGIKVDIFGNGWGEVNFTNDNLKFHAPVTGEDYSNTINKSKICLCFLRQANRDSITVRSVEIPAYGGFLLGEYSVEHQFLLQNNVEAIWCSNNQEFLSNIKFYLENSILREEIVKNGYTRVSKLNCSYETQARYIKDRNYTSVGN
jgi:spore maturation protein CgeB